jgi:hypothetical protein
LAAAPTNEVSSALCRVREEGEPGSIYFRENVGFHHVLASYYFT